MRWLINGHLHTRSRSASEFISNVYCNPGNVHKYQVCKLCTSSFVGNVKKQSMTQSPFYNYFNITGCKSETRSTLVTKYAAILYSDPTCTNTINCVQLCGNFGGMIHTDQYTTTGMDTVSTVIISDL